MVSYRNGKKCCSGEPENFCPACRAQVLRPNTATGFVGPGMLTRLLGGRVEHVRATAVPPAPSLAASIRAQRAVPSVPPTRVATNGVPPAPDLNARIRARRGEA